MKKIFLKAGQGVFGVNKKLALCFAIPAGIMTAAFAINFIFPLGPQSVLSIDLYHMYAPLIVHLHDMIYSGSVGGWTWGGGMGINFFTLFFTNTGSPLNAVIALFPKWMLTELLALGMILKVGLCGLCAGWFLRYKWKRCDVWTVVFAALYAHCGYMGNYYWNIMWTDVLFLLPLCMLGIEILVDSGRFRTYVLALAAAMVCNYYIAALMCAFLAIYFVIAVVSRFSVREQFKWILKRTGQFALYSILAAAIAALVLLPVWDALQATSVVMDEFPRTWETYSSFIDVLKNHLPGARPNMRSGGLPHIYAGLLAIWLLPVYLLHRGIALKERLLSLFALAFMIFCLNFTIPNFIWHGFHVPNDLPFRYSFCYSMLIVTMACPAARRLGRKSFAICAVWGAFMLAFLYATEFLMKEEYNYDMLIAVPVLLAAYGAIYILRQKKKIRRRRARRLLLGVLCIELAFSTAVAVASTGNMNRELYVEPVLEYGSAVAETLEADDSLYRMDTWSYMTLNDSLLYGFNGIGHFSSMLPANLQDLLHKMGYAAYMYGYVRSNRTAGLPNTAVADSMFGVKYRLAPATQTAAISGRPDGVWRIGSGSLDNITLYNNYALPFAYMVNESVLTNWDYGSSNPFNVQQSLLNSVLEQPRQVFNSVDFDEFSGDSLTLSRNGASFYFKGSDTEEPGKAVFKYTAQQSGLHYFFASGDQLMRGTIEVLNSEIFINTDSQYFRIVPIGNLKEGEQIVIELTLGRSASEGSFTALLSALDMEQFDAAMAELASGNLRNIEHGTDYIRGTVSVGPGQALFTTIPADPGWKLYVDGRETEFETTGGGAFLAARLPEGEHEIELKWTLIGFDTGVKISLVGLLAFVLFYVISRLAGGEAPPKRLPVRRKRPVKRLAAAEGPPMDSGIDQPIDEPDEPVDQPVDESSGEQTGEEETDAH